jgi:4-amino-4-deoxy-L-arabinose transferase-like glycosyltransferase
MRLLPNGIFFYSNQDTKWISKPIVLVIVILLFIFSLLSISYHNLQEWDEARNGVNAYEMYHNGDYINFYYNNEIDTWNAKPPLMIWLIVCSYNLFGFNEFALRLPSLISAILLLIIFYKTIRLFENESIALLSCIILYSTKAILGNHIGLTGDFDALLILFLASSSYYFLSYFERQNKSAIYLFAIILGFAFYTKGTAAFVFLPGMLIYLTVRKKIITAFKDKNCWLALLINMAIICSWIILVLTFGKTSIQSHYGSSNSLETLFVHDTIKRFSDSSFGEIHEKKYFFFFEVLDTRMNIWNYVFYLVVFGGIYSILKRRESLKDLINIEKNSLVLFSICIIIPLSLFLTFATSKHSWYLAPVFMFVAYLTAKGVVYYAITKRFKLIITCVIAFTAIRHMIYIVNQPSETHKILIANKELQNQVIYAKNDISQDILLYFKWLNCRIQKVNDDQFNNLENKLLLYPKSDSNKYERLILQLDEYDIVQN